MARVTPKEFQEKHARRLKASLEDMKSGVERVTEAPTAKAAKKVDKMRANLLAALDSGKWQRRLNAVPLEEWKRKMIDVGVPRVSAGIDAAAAKTESFAAELLPHVDKISAEVKKMPDVTLDDNINRMVSFIRGMAKFERKG